MIISAEGGIPSINGQLKNNRDDLLFLLFLFSCVYSLLSGKFFPDSGVFDKYYIKLPVIYPQENLISYDLPK